MNKENNLSVNSYPESGAGSNLIRIGLGVMTGLIAIQLLNLGWLLASVILGAVIIIFISLDSYKGWLILLAASTVSGSKYSAGGVFIRPDQVALIILILGWTPALLANRARLYRVPLLLPAALYVGVNFLSSALFSWDRSASYQACFLLGLYVFMYVISVLVLQDHPDKLKSAVKFLLVVGVAVSIYSVIAFAGYRLGVDLGGMNESQLGDIGTIQSGNIGSVQGGFEEPNLLGAFTAAIALMFIAFLAGKNVGIKTEYLVFGLLLVMTVLALTYTRAAWVGFIVALVPMFFLQKPKYNFFNPRAAAVMLAMLVIALLVALPFGNAITAGSIETRALDILNFGTASAVGRTEVQRVAIERWHQSEMLGYGTLSLPPTVNVESPAGGWLYSSFIQALHDTGIIGLVFLVWFQGGVLFIVVRGYRRTNDTFYKAALAGFAASSIALFIASQASSFLWLGFPWIFSGLGVAIAQVAIREAEKSESPASRARVS